eukprot:3446203-Prymnesium_polylepis.1
MILVAEGCASNKEHAVKYVDTLQQSLGSFRQKGNSPVAQTLSAIYADNEALLDNVDSGLVARVFGLIRLQGPSESAHYLEFLAALCQCSGAPKRHNQRLIANQLAEVGAIMRLYYDEGDDHTLGMGIMICGDHPKLQRPEGLASWLKRMKLGGDEPLVAFLESPVCRASCRPE